MRPYIITILTIGLILLAILIVLIILTSRKLVIEKNHYEKYENEMVGMCYPHKKTTQPIPKIIHQIWIHPRGLDELPDQYKKWSGECRELNSEYEYKLWDGPKSRELIASEYPWFLSTWDSYDRQIKKIDAIRYFFLHRYGGVYIDMDFICLKKLDDILKDNDGCAIFGYQYDTDSVLLKGFRYLFSDDIVCNAIMISPPKHHLFDIMIHCLHLTKNLGVVQATGPRFLTNAIDIYPHEDVVLYKTPLMYTQPWNSGDQCLSQDECRKKHPTAYMSTPFAGSWVTMSNLRQVFLI